MVATGVATVGQGLHSDSNCPEGGWVAGQEGLLGKGTILIQTAPRGRGGVVYTSLHVEHYIFEKN